MRRILLALVVCLPLFASASSQDEAERVLVHYDFEEDDIETGPYTLWIFEGAKGSVSLSSSFRYSGLRSVEIRDQAGDGVRRVRFSSLADEGMKPGLAEIQLLSRPGGGGLNPSDPSDTALDFDGDGLTNLEEFNRGTSLFLEDTDSDGLDDSAEEAFGANPLLSDTDNDGLLDGLEPSPTLDTDGDGLVNILDPEATMTGFPTGSRLSRVSIR